MWYVRTLMNSTYMLHAFIVVCIHMRNTYICSTQSENLRNLEIALRILRILKLRTTVTRSRDCAPIARNLSPRRACAETISWLQEKLQKNGDFVSVLRNRRVQAMMVWLSLVETKPALLRT